jgi:hypothetical protein
MGFLRSKENIVRVKKGSIVTKSVISNGNRYCVAKSCDKMIRALGDQCDLCSESVLKRRVRDVFDHFHQSLPDILRIGLSVLR